MTTIRAYRRSSAADDLAQTLEQQTHLTSRYAAFKYPDAPLVWYEDAGVSGAATAKLKERARLLAELKRGDVLVVTKIDRLARNVRDLLEILQHCETVGATFVATEQDISTSGAYGRFTIVLLGALAALERDIVSERVKAARAQFKADGRYGFEKIPYGFTTVRNEQTKWLELRPDPET